MSTPKNQNAKVEYKKNVFELLVELTGLHPNEIDKQHYPDPDRKDSDSFAYQLALMIFDEYYYQDAQRGTVVDFAAVREVLTALSRYTPTNSLYAGYAKKGIEYIVRDPRLPDGADIFWVSASANPYKTLSHARSRNGSPVLSQRILEIQKYAIENGFKGIFFEETFTCERRFKDESIPLSPSRVGYLQVVWEVIGYSDPDKPRRMYEVAAEYAAKGQPIINSFGVGRPSNKEIINEIVANTNVNRPVTVSQRNPDNKKSQR